MRAVRPVLVLALAGVAAWGTSAFAADAPRSTTTSRTLFMAQNGCGTSAEDGRLELKPQADTADGCGTIGGLPANEVFHADESDFGPLGDDYTSTPKLPPFVMDTTKKVTGQVAAESWIGHGAGGLGTVTWDVSLTGTTTSGKLIDFGSTTVSAPASPGNDDVFAPFSFAVPRSATGLTFKRFVANVELRGQNVGMSAKKLNGDTYIVFPVKPKTSHR